MSAKKLTKRTNIYSIVIALILLLALVGSRWVVGKINAVTDSLQGGNSTIVQLGQLLSQSNHSVLLVFMNNTELRFGGGFIGSVGFVELKSGKPTVAPIKSVYAYDRLTQALPETPIELSKVTTGVTLRDSAISLNWSDNARRAQSFYTQATGRTADTVIGLTPSLVQALLRQFGPVRIGQTDQAITADNFYDVVQKEVESGQDNQAGNDPKSILGDIATVLLDRLANQKPAELVRYEQVINDQISQKNFALYSTDQQLQQFAKSRRLDQQLGCRQFDCLVIAEANGGADKSSRFMQNRVYKQVNIDQQGVVTVDLRIERKHSSDYLYPYVEPKTGKPNWLVKQNISYLKIGVPRGAKLLKSDNIPTLNTANEDNFTTFGFWSQLQPLQETSYSLQYQLPQPLPMANPTIYSQELVKQVGGWPYQLQTTVKMPENYQLKLTNNKSILMTNSGFVVYKATIEGDDLLQLQYAQQN